jgi:hypothetical protein
LRDWLIYLDCFILFVLPIKSCLVLMSAVYLSGILYNICTAEFLVINHRQGISKYYFCVNTTIQMYSTGYKITSCTKDINDVMLKEGIICLGSQKRLMEPSIKCSCTNSIRLLENKILQHGIESDVQAIKTSMKLDAWVRPKAILKQ